MESLDNVLNFLNTVIWEYLLIYVLIGAGIYFSVRSIQAVRSSVQCNGGIAPP